MAFQRLGGLPAYRYRDSLLDRMSHPLAALLDRLRIVFAREELPQAPPEPVRRSRRGIVALLFSAEPLPVEPEQASPPRRRRGLLAVAFAPEDLPLEPESPPRRHLPWLRWLLLPERIDQDPNRTEVN